MNPVFASLKKISVLILLFLLGCSDKAAAPAMEKSPRSLSWEQFQVPSSNWRHEEKGSIENLSFYANGDVHLTLGTKDALVAPAFYWRIEGDKLLVCQTQQGKAMFSYRSPRIDGNQLTVIDDHGKEFHYLLSRAPAAKPE
jgi:hypothetical protein